MPFYDLTCENSHNQIDVLLKIGERPPCPICGLPTETLWLPTSVPSVIGDECDITIYHGICNEDGSPRRYRSKSEMSAEAKRRGLVNAVRHAGGRESDKSNHTSRWI